MNLLGIIPVSIGRWNKQRSPALLRFCNLEVLMRVVVLLLSLLAATSWAITPEDEQKCRGFFRFTSNNLYDGLTKDGLAALKEQRDRVRANFGHVNSRLLHAHSAIHAAFVARLLRGHMFVYGPPGGAKTLLIRELLALEEKPSFQIQLHQSMTEQPLIGGQDFEAAKRGEYIVNTKGSLATFKTANLDEIDKANPGVLSVLLGLLNEREVQVGREVIKADLETLFTTSNAILPEILDAFRENGQLSTAAALLNRFQFKVCLYNWLENADQKLLSKVRFGKLWNEAIRFEHNPDFSTKSEALKPVDWEKLRAFALYIVHFSDEALDAYTYLVNELRDATNHELDASRRRHEEDPESEPFVYFPTADYSERLRQVVPEVVLYSVFLDFLLSPLADDEIIGLGFLDKPIVLQPSSLWRSYLTLTTIFSGDAELQNRDGKFSVHFSNKVDANKMRDNRERGLLKMITKEQERFEAHFKQIANYCAKCPNSAWLVNRKGYLNDIEELLQPNKESDRIRREALSRDEAADEERERQKREEKKLAKKKLKEEEKRKMTLPGGSYKDSCDECLMDSSGSLECKCAKWGGTSKEFTKLVDAYLCETAINHGGQLECTKPRE